MTVAPAKSSIVSDRNTRIGGAVRCVFHRSGMHENAGSFPGRKGPGAISPDANQVCFENGSRPHASAEGAEQVSTRSSADPRFGLALHYRCNLLARGACGGRQVGCRRPSGQCTGSHEKGPPHLSRSRVARVGGPFTRPAGQARRVSAAVKSEASRSRFLRSRQPEMPPASLLIHALVRSGPGSFLRRNKPGFA